MNKTATKKRTPKGLQIIQTGSFVTIKIGDICTTFSIFAGLEVPATPVGQRYFDGKGFEVGSEDYFWCKHEINEATEFFNNYHNGSGNFVAADGRSFIKKVA
jgi:hypothetical protein